MWRSAPARSTSPWSARSPREQRIAAVAVAVATRSPSESRSSPAMKATSRPRRTIRARAAQLAGLCRLQELNVQVGRRRPLAVAEGGDERRAQGVVEHRRQEAALHGSGRVEELIGCGEGDLDRPLLGIDLDELPARAARRPAAGPPGPPSPPRTAPRRAIGLRLVGGLGGLELRRPREPFSPSATSSSSIVVLFHLLAVGVGRLRRSSWHRRPAASRPCACGDGGGRRPSGSCGAAPGRRRRACGRRASWRREEPPRPRAYGPRRRRAARRRGGGPGCARHGPVGERCGRARGRMS